MGRIGVLDAVGGGTELRSPRGRGTLLAADERCGALGGELGYLQFGPPSRGRSADPAARPGPSLDRARAVRASPRDHRLPRPRPVGVTGRPGPRDRSPHGPTGPAVPHGAVFARP